LKRIKLRNHPYLVKSFNKGYVLKEKGEIMNNLPLNSEGLTLFSNFDKSEKITSISGGLNLNTTIPECSLGGKSFLFRKCLSKVNMTRDSDLAILDNCLSVEPKETSLILCPCFINDLITSFGKFSSERNFSLFLEKNIFLFSDEFRSICHNREDSLFCERWKIILENFINANTCSEQFQNLPDHDSCSFECRSSATDFRVNDNVIINLNSHEFSNPDNYLKLSNWLKVSELNVGDEIAVADSNGEVKFEKIVLINRFAPQHVYDLEIEGTHNFVANDIVAHNTYLGDSTADTVTITGNFSVDSSTLFVDSVSNNVGIGTTSPDHDLEIGTGTYSEIDAGEAQFTTGSSRTYKENIEPVYIDNILDKIAEVPVNTYDFRPELCNDSDDKCKNKIGLIAEDFHVIFERGSDKQLNGNEVQMALWLGIQELKAENNELKFKNQQILNRLELLENK